MNEVPMKDVILVHYGELALKMSNREYFETKLVQAIRESLQDFRNVRVRKLFGRFIVRTQDLAEKFPEVSARLQNVFGIAWFGRALAVDQDMMALKAATTRLLPETPELSFGVETKRADPRWTQSSQSTSAELGAHVLSLRPWKVNLRKPDLWVRVEITNGQMIVGVERIKGLRGLPVGSSGRVLCLLSGGIDSPVAAWRMMSRGCRVVMAHFHSFPHTSQASQDKVVDLVRSLNLYQSSIILHQIPFAETQREIVLKTPARFRVLLYRRFMIRVAAAVAELTRCEALVTGESLGQVASQTLANLRSVESVTDYSVLRPLIGLDKEEIIAQAQRLGSFDISIRPHEDCCTYLMPKKPAISSTLADLLEAEKDLDVAALVNSTLEGVEAFRVVRGQLTRLMRPPQWARGATPNEVRPEA